MKSEKVIDVLESELLRLNEKAIEAEENYKMFNRLKNRWSDEYIDLIYRMDGIQKKIDTLIDTGNEDMEDAIEFLRLYRINNK